jgi:hypothetical protein
MATRSKIAIENQDGTVTAIYCHWDGYVDGVGKTLFENYDREKLEQLIELGDISSLGETLDETVAYHGFEGIDYIYCSLKDGRLLVSNGGPVIDLVVAIEEGL